MSTILRLLSFPKTAMAARFRRHRIKAASPSQAVLNVIRRGQYPLNRTYFEVFRKGLRAVKHYTPVAVFIPSDFDCCELHKALGWLDEVEKDEWDDDD